jgi:hypothetical protein
MTATEPASREQPRPDLPKVACTGRMSTPRSERPIRIIPVHEVAARITSRECGRLELHSSLRSSRVGAAVHARQIRLAIV